ncbi:transient receptor potential cation channel protein painless-like [Wyeomyia smithii]|uniref:transient receptor potential cation channel protein painless-like n=1 Tax=Wyeomyia smithii TaxID=174621 RepID=UPI002467F3AC|nr:transient receptor potential cation channel protein painless-like [Wyeomyia smithii]XP_055547242.1 transient receptor potential cation channel protein painless-like [Wyeomyia smithii]
MSSGNNIQLLCISDQQQALSASLAEKNLKSFQYALRRGADPAVRDDLSGLSVFEKACETAGSAKFIEECLVHGVDTQQPNANGKFPIHFAVLSEDAEHFQALLSEGTNPNLLYQDQTALHLLFERLNSDNWKRVFPCIQVLIQSEPASVNIPNSENRTPVGVFVKNSKNWQKNSEDWRKEILQYCLKFANVDVDTFRKGELRKKIQDFFPDVTIPSFIMETNLSVLVTLIKTLNEDKFNSELQKYRSKQVNESEWQNDFWELLSMAVQSGRLSFVKTLLENDYKFSAESRLPELLTKCCNYGYHDILSFILSKTGHTAAHIRTINSVPLLSLVIKEINTLKDRAKCPFFKCLDILLDDDRIEIDKVDSKGCSALHYAVKYKVDGAVELLLKHSAYIGTVNMFKELPICEMSPEILQEHLNSCITTNDKRPGDDDYEVNIDFSCLVPPVYKRNHTGDVKKDAAGLKEISDEMLPIVYMANSGDMKPLLKHPVISSFVLIKWLRLSIYFYINFLICTTFFLAFTWYVVGCYGQDNVDRFLKESLRIISLLGTTYIALREIGQMMLHTKMYLYSIENWMEITLVVAAYTVLLKEFEQSEIRQIISAVVILLSALEFTLLVGMLPVLSISTHMVMLKTVSKNFLKSLILYSIILISFAFCFYTLFHVKNATSTKDSIVFPDDVNKVREEETKAEEPKEDDKFNTFGDIGTALLKTMVMLTGEFEAANIKFESNGVSYLIFLLFLFFVAIVIFNLMNGLAVSDTAAIKAEAELIGLSQKVDVISKYENALKFPNTNGVLTNLIHCIFPRTFLQLFPTYLPYYYVIITPNQSNSIFIPRPQKHVDQESVLDVESHFELLPENARSNERFKLSFGCCILPSFSKMDGKVMKYAKEILHSRNQRIHSKDKLEMLEVRLTTIEHNIERILQFLNRDGK